MYHIIAPNFVHEGCKLAHVARVLLMSVNLRQFGTQSLIMGMGRRITSLVECFAVFSLGLLHILTTKECSLGRGQAGKYTHSSD